MCVYCPPTHTQTATTQENTCNGQMSGRSAAYPCHLIRLFCKRTLRRGVQTRSPMLQSETPTRLPTLLQTFGQYLPSDRLQACQGTPSSLAEMPAALASTCLAAVAETRWVARADDLLVQHHRLPLSRTLLRTLNFQQHGPIR